MVKGRGFHYTGAGPDGGQLRQDMGVNISGNRGYGDCRAPAIPLAIFRWALSWDAPMENDTNNRVVDSKMDSSITAVRIFLSLTFIKIYFNMISLY